MASWRLNLPQQRWRSLIATPLMERYPRWPLNGQDSHRCPRQRPDLPTTSPASVSAKRATLDPPSAAHAPPRGWQTHHCLVQSLTALLDPCQRRSRGVRVKGPTLRPIMRLMWMISSWWRLPSRSALPDGFEPVALASAVHVALWCRPHHHSLMTTTSDLGFSAWILVIQHEVFGRFLPIGDTLVQAY